MRENLDSHGSLALHNVSAEVNIVKELRRNLNLVDGTIHVIEVSSAQEMELFVQLPHQIYKNDYYWPGQDDSEELAYLDPQSNSALNYLELQPFLAIRDGEIVGRICACINNRHNEYYKDQVGFFGFFESINDQEVANELLRIAETWLGLRGKNEMMGPVSPTFMDVVGLLEDGFDELPTVALSYNPKYYVDLLSNYGLTQSQDLVEMLVDTHTLYETMETKIHKVTPFLEDHEISTRYFDKNNFDKDATIVRDIFFESFQDHWGFYSMENEEWKDVLNHYLSIAREELFIIIEDAGEPIAFVLCIDDINQERHAIRHGNQSEIKRQKLEIISVKPSYIRGGIGTFLMYNLIPGLKQHNVEEFSVSWILADNYNSIGLCKSLGMKKDKNYRVYKKVID